MLDESGDLLSTQTNVVLGWLEGNGRWCIDTPAADFAEQKAVLNLRGWLALPQGATLNEGPFLCTQRGHYHLGRSVRRDVETELPGFHVVGFDEVVDLAVLYESEMTMSVVVDGQKVDLALLGIAGLEQKAASFLSTKAKKLQRINAMLACPVCGGELAVQFEVDLICTKCAYRGVVSDRRYQLTVPGVVPFELAPPYSAHSYDGEPRGIIDQLAGGLILDAGCGLRYEYFDNVVNLDLSPFPTTDVVASLEALPFASASFDGAISVAVLEHVEDPRHCVQELARVVRPGGALYAAVPFLQPYHGYPHHYFNMTRDALALLFEPFFDIEDIHTPEGGAPIRALSWMLEWYLNGLGEPARSELASMTVGELAGDPTRHLHEAYVTDLDDTVAGDLACVNVLLATRKAR